MTTYPIELASLPVGVVLDQYGNALTGVSVYVYSRGTTTQVDVYADSGLTSLNTQPIDTNADGVIPGYVADTQSVDIADAETGTVLGQAEVVSAQNLGSGGTVDSVTAGDGTITVGGTSSNPTVKVTSGTYDAAGTATSAVATETTRAETAEALLAPKASPALTGTPTAPTASGGTNTTQIATTAFVTAAVPSVPSASSSTPVVDGTGAAGSATTFARGDHVHPTDTSRAALASPTFTGTPAAPTATGGTNTTQIATTAFVTTAVAGASGAVTSVFTRTGAVVATSGDYTVSQVTGAAPLASPTLTGTPAAPTAAASTNTTQIATTAFVVGQAGTATPIIDGTAAVGTSLLYARQDHVHASDTTKANLASPTLTGTPAAPTASAGTTTTQIATTAFTQTAVLAPVVQSTTSGSTFAILSTSGAAKLTALAAACTISVSGTPADCQKLFLRIKDNSTTHAITWTGFVSSGVATLPTATNGTGKTMAFEFVYDSVTSNYVLYAVDSTGY